MAGAARAHGFHASFSVLELNPRSGSLEIIHRLFVQDIEILLTARAGRPVVLGEAADAEASVQGYLHKVFTVKAANGDLLKPAWVGLKLQVDTLFVYEELKDAAGLDVLIINDQILTETHPGQVNTVNVTAHGRTQTLLFTAADAPQAVKIAG